MRDYGEDINPCCYFHPKEVVVGICALCLKERLLVLASKEDHLQLPQPSGTHQRYSSFRTLKRKSSINLRKVFALGSFLQLLENRYRGKKDDSDELASVASLEDSFISIKFENNGDAISWPNKKAISTTVPSTSITCGSGITMAKDNSMVEHAKHGGAPRWHARIGRILQLAHWKRSNKASTGHVGFGSKVDGFKGRRAWIRSLTSRRTE